MKKHITAAIFIAIIACMNIGCNKDNPSTTTDKDNPSTTTDKGNPSTTTDKGNPSTTTDKGNPSTTTDKGNPSTSKDIITIPSEFIPDNEWRKKVSDLDTERCVNDIISNLFDYKMLNELSINSLNEKLAITFVTDTTLAINTILDTKKDADFTFIATVLVKAAQDSEEVIYNQSKGKYRCNVENIARYQIKEYNGNDKSLPNVFRQFVKQYAKSEIEQLDTEAIEILSTFSYIVMLNKVYNNFIESSGYNTASNQATNNSNVHINHRERHQIMPVYNAEECKFYKNAKLTPDAKTAPKNLSRFFKSFNPSFYEYAIQRFIENPITVTRTAKTCTMPLDGECYYYEQFFLDSNCSVSISEKNAFITVSDAQKYQLNKGDVFPTCLLDSKKSNKSGTECRGKFKNNSYWQVLEDTPRTIYHWSQGTDSEECNEVRDKVIFVYDQEGIETRRALYNEIELGMQNLNQLCQ